MLRHKDDETLKREVSLWLERNGIPYRRYQNLSAYLKGVLRNLVCIPTRPTSHEERRNLYMELCLPDIPARDRDDLVPPDEGLRKFFTPVAQSETLSYLEKF